MSLIINGIYIYINKCFTTWSCRLHREKKGSSSTPHPSIRQVERDLVINTPDLSRSGKLLIVGIVLSTIDDGGVLLSLGFLLLYQASLLLSDALQED